MSQALLQACRGFVDHYLRDPALVSEQRGWFCSIGFIASDTGEEVSVRVEDGRITAVDPKQAGCDVVITAESPILIEILELRRNPNEPYLFGELTVRGPESDFVRLDYIADRLCPE